MDRFLGLLLVAAFVLFGCTKQLDDISKWEVVATDPILAVGHGAFFGAEGKRIDPSPEFVIEAQRFYLKRLYLAANEKQRAAFDAVRRRIAGEAAENKAEQILLNAAYIHWLADATRPSDLAHLTSTNTALLTRYARLDGKQEKTEDQGAGSIRGSLLARLKEYGLLKFLSATTAGGVEYINECRMAGVPIPPDWGTPQWQSNGLLTVDFLGSTPQAEVFSFQTDAPRGVCMALPRSTGNTISLLGIICLGTQTSKSCYWDNQRNKQQFPIQKGTVVPLSDFAGGAELFMGSGGVCTDCHAGENPYVVHPGQPMDLPTIIPNWWTDPLVHPSWPQNAGPNSILPGIALAAGDRSCLQCHARPPGRRFPEVSTAIPFYCNIVLPNAIGKTMPSAGGNAGPFKKHIDALMAACKKPPSGEVVVNGATQTDPTGGRVDTGGDLSICTSGGDCPVGFCYWKTLHGPFWQTSPANLPLADPAHRGSFLRIYAEGGHWKWRAFSDPTGLPPNAPPGGTAECLAYNQIATVPNPQNCFANPFSVADPSGTLLSQSINATVAGSTANVLSGFIGNVAQANKTRILDTLRVWEDAGRVRLDHNHSGAPATQYPAGLLVGESWTNGCNAWTPVYAAKDVFTMSEVQLVPAAQSSNVRCYITGISGAWSSTRNNATVQPFAEIFKGSGNDIRLRVRPNEGGDRVGAYASCIRLN